MFCFVVLSQEFSVYNSHSKFPACVCGESPLADSVVTDGFALIPLIGKHPKGESSCSRLSSPNASPSRNVNEDNMDMVLTQRHKGKTT